MSDWQFDLVAGPFGFTEGPAWDGAGLVFSDIPNSLVLRYDPATGQTTQYRSGTNEANGLMFDRSGVLHACEGGPEGRCIARYGADGSRVVLADRFEGRRLNSPNDLAFDHKGRLWFTDPRYGDKTDDLELPHQSVYRLDPPARGGGPWPITRVTFDTTKPNGLLVTPDARTLYVAQSEYGEGNPRELRAYPLDDKGNVNGPCAVLHNFYPHRGIDGMCFDVDGNIVATSGWEKSGPGPMIHVFAPSGRVLETHPVPKLPTNCTWGDADLMTLYVTAGGCLFRARTGRRGYLVYPPSP